MTTIITGGRGTGKTAMLIRHSAETGRYILVTNSTRARGIIEQAKAMELYIPFPITVEEFKRGGRYEGSSIRRDGVLVDDFDNVLWHMFNGIDIKEITIGKDSLDNSVYDLDKWQLGDGYENHI